jgi:hypothetical protein
VCRCESLCLGYGHLKRRFRGANRALDKGTCLGYGEGIKEPYYKRGYACDAFKYVVDHHLKGEGELLPLWLCDPRSIRYRVMVWPEMPTSERAAQEIAGQGLAVPRVW